MEEITILDIEPVFRYGLSTLVLLVIVFILRAGLHHSILERSTLRGDTRRRWAVNIRNTLVFFSVVGLFFIWAPHLQTFAVTFLAIAVAFVIATKEFLDCLIGSMFRTVSNAYSIGERIEINGIRGNVVDHNFLTTTLLEIGPGQTSHQYTGRALVIPNSLFLKHSLTNETYSKDYRLHIITVPLHTDEDWELAVRILLEVANEECDSYLQEAKRKMKALEGKAWLDAPSVEPRVSIQLPEPGYINLLLRVPCPTAFPSRLEQAILKKFLSRFHFGKKIPSGNTFNNTTETTFPNQIEKVVPVFDNVS